jgi:hypothetical protein
MTMVLAHDDRKYKEQGKHHQRQDGYSLEITDDVLVSGQLGGSVCGFGDLEYEAFRFFAITWFFGHG